MKALKWLLGIIGVLLLLVLLVVLSVPRWLSTTGGREFVIRKANANFDGSIDIEILNLGWFSPPSVSGITVKDEAGRTQVTVRSVQGSRSLAQLARNYKELGEWRVERPEIFVYLDEPAPPPEVVPLKPDPAPPKPDPVEPAPPEPIQIPELRVKLAVEDGSLFLVPPGKAPEATIRNLTLGLEMDGTQRPLSYELAMDAGQGSGSVRASGTMDLAPLAIDPMGAVIEAALTVSDWSVSDTLALLGAIAEVPQGEGTLHANLKIKGSAAAGLDLEGRVDVRQLALSGEALQGDQPQFGDIELALSARVEGDDVTLSQARLVSDIARLAASGEVRGGEPVALDATGRVDLAALTKQLPNTLGLKEDLSIREGLINLSAKIELNGDIANVQASVRMDRLEGTSEGRPLVWDQPVELSLQALKGPEVLRIEQLTASMPFLQLEGSGDLSDFALTLNSDLGLAMSEAGKFVDLQEWAVAGSLNANVRLRSDAVATEEEFRAPSRVQATVNLAGDSLEVRNGAQMIVPSGPITLDLAASLSLDEEGQLRGISEPSLDWRAWIGDGSFRAQRIEVAAEPAPPHLEGVVVQARFDLPSTGRTLMGLEAIPDDLVLEGTLRVNSEVDAADGRMQVQTRLQGEQVSVRKAGERLAPPSDPSLSITAALRMDETGELVGVETPSLSWKTWLSEGSFSARSIEMGEADQPPNIAGASLEAEANLSQVSGLLAALDLLPDDMELGGTATLNGLLALEQHKRLKIETIQVALEAFRFRQGEQSMPTQALSLQTAGSMDIEAGTLELPDVRITTMAGDLSLTNIRVADLEHAADTASARLQGQMDVARLIEMLGDFAALPEATSLSAGLSLEGSLQTTADEQTVDLVVGLSDLVVREDGEIRIQETEPITLAARVMRRPDRLDIQPLTLSANALSMDLRAGLATHESQSDLNAEGRLALDLEAISAYLQTLLELDIVMTGREEKPFRISASWQEDAVAEGMMNAEIEAGVHAERIEAFGLVIRDLAVPIRMKERRAEVAITGLVNDGELSLLPFVDFSAEPPMLAFPPESVLLRQVRLTEAMSNDLLAKFHTLFRGASGVLGRMDMRMDHFEWPLSEEHAALRRLKGAVLFEELTIRSSAMWGLLMQFARVSEQEMDLGDQRVDFELRENRIHCSPIRIDIGQPERLVLFGSVGLDQTLDYTASIPVTEGMARSVGVSANDYTNFLAGTSINVPIRGTATEPDIGAHVLTQMAADLARQAGRRAVEERATRAIEGLFGRPRQEEE